MMLFLQLDATLSGSSKSSIAKISGLVSLISQFGLTNVLGYATYNLRTSMVVLFAENALVVGRIQVAFDPNLFPFTEKSSDDPRYKFVHTLLGRGSDANRWCGQPCL
jgi:hypothetical protein